MDRKKTLRKNNIFTKSAVSLLLAIGMGATSVQASDVKYNYIEGRYILDAEADNNVDGDGFQLGGSFRIANDFYLIGSYQSLDLDFNNDIDTLKVGAGYILPIHDKWDANFSLSLVNSDTNNNDDSGFAVSAGVRGMLTPKIEGRASVNYIDVNNSDTYITLGGDYFVLRNLSVGVEADVSGDLDTVSIGARYFF